MTTAVTDARPNRRSESHWARGRLAMCLAPVAALAYPFTLNLFSTAVTALAGGHTPRASAALAVIGLFLSFALPALAVAAALGFAGIERPTAAQVRAKRTAIFAVTAPTIFVFLGVLLYMAGDPVPDLGIWVVLWTALIVALLRADNTVLAVVEVRPFAPALRVAHGVSALAIVIVFLGFHLSNHIAGLSGPEAHTAIMKAVRHVYRAAAVEPVLVGLFFFQVGSGLYLAFQRAAGPMDRFQAFQVASGVYLAFYVLGHMDSVFIYARTFLGIETGWDFATGAPTGLVKDPWNIRLVPHYALGVFFVLAHLASGLRVILLTHGTRKAIADRVMIGGAAGGALIATIIILAMCGMRIYFV